MEQNRQKTDRRAAWVLFGIGLFAVFGGAFQMRSHLFSFDRALEAKLNEAVEERLASVEGLEGTEEGTDLASLQTTDSDQDGLTDFEEVYVRGTSPYLQDTDSDGIDDFTEIAENTDPNCPEGQDCLQERVGGDVIVTDAERALGGLSAANDTSVSLDDNISADEIRAMLAESGVPQDQIDQVPDEELINVYQQVSQDQASGANGITNVQSEVDKLRSMGIDERRSYLVQSGLSAGDIENLSDDEVNELFEEAIAVTLQELGIQE